MASQKQTTLIEQLADERVMDPDDRNRLMKRLHNGDLDVTAATATITWLFKQPRKPTQQATYQDQQKFVWQDKDVRTAFEKAEKMKLDPRSMTVLRELVPEGRFAVVHEGTLKFYKVDKPTEGKWAGYMFLNVLASDQPWPIQGKMKFDVLRLIADDPKAAMLRYGIELRHCGHCGRAMTDAKSRARGIGPICAGRMGW